VYKKKENCHICEEQKTANHMFECEESRDDKLTQ